ncbi:MAG: hypothetical protein IJZ93_06620 [Clostridia bacterium]|nr:hypothetical protein [Clostridia bacterium]
MKNLLNDRKKLVSLIVMAVLLIAFVICSIAVNGDNEASRYSETFMALAAPIIAIVLALITKEVYSSLFIGIIIGGLLSASYNIPKTLDYVINDGLISAV